jgi:hypothetical protein
LSISRRFVAKGVLGCSEGKENAGSSRRARESRGSKQQKKYERSQYVIENTGRHVRNELKRTQNEPQLSAEIRALRAEFEFSSTSQVLADASNGNDGRGRDRPVGGIQRTAREYENRGNEAKKYLKTKDITFLKVANLACFVRKSAAISPQREQMTPHFAKTKSRLATPSVTA